MIKSVFVDPQKLKGIQNCGANHLIIVINGLDEVIWHRLKSLGITLGVSIGSFDHGGCPADPKASVRLKDRIGEALKFQPDELWLDHFRFDGHWETIEGINIPRIHQECRWCQGKNRVKIITKHAQEVMKLTNKKVRVGYFAVPFKSDEIPQLVLGLGQDHFVMGKIFDLSSPMLYHRMIKRPVSYISDFVTWISNQTGKPVLPIIQIKDMPDDLEDKLSEEEIAQAFQEATKPPSIGVCFFCWAHALEKQKTDIICKLFAHQQNINTLHSPLF